VLPYLLSYADLADSLKRKRPPDRSLLVCIDGCGASGKSSIAAGLAAASEDVQIVHVDDFYRPSSERYAGPLAQRPVAADFDLARLRAQVLEPLRAGMVAEYRAYDWATDRLLERRVSVTKPVVIVEGVYSSSLGLSELFEFSIWVECSRELRLARGLERDGEAARSRWEDDWMPGEDSYVQRESPQLRAALVCDGGREDCGTGVVVLRERMLQQAALTKP
jgi:uridine kinase